jgi:hypothetical protein
MEKTLLVELIRSTSDPYNEIYPVYRGKNGKSLDKMVDEAVRKFCDAMGVKEDAFYDAFGSVYGYNLYDYVYVVTGELDTVDLTTKKTTVSDEEVFDEIFDIFMNDQMANLCCNKIYKGE